MKIDWEGLLKEVRRHLYQWARKSRLTILLASNSGSIRTQTWRTGPWYKDFGTFKLVGEGRYPKTFLLRGQIARGQRID
jgi:hypothetical protein